MAGLDPAIHAASPRARRLVWRHGDGGGPHPTLHAPPMDARIKSGHDEWGMTRTVNAGLPPCAAGSTLRIDFQDQRSQLGERELAIRGRAFPGRRFRLPKHVASRAAAEKLNTDLSSARAPPDGSNVPRVGKGPGTPSEPGARLGRSERSRAGTPASGRFRPRRPCFARCRSALRTRPVVRRRSTRGNPEPGDPVSPSPKPPRAILLRVERETPGFYCQDPRIAIARPRPYSAAARPWLPAKAGATSSTNLCICSLTIACGLRPTLK